jgi:SAM-dependent methyltransferase
MKLKWRGINSLIYGLIRKDLPGKSVVDLGSGHGRLVLLCAREAEHVTGVELEDAAVRVARILKDALKTRNVDFLNGDLATHRPEDEKYDYVLLNGVLWHLVEPESAFESAHVILKDGGVFVIGTTLEANFRGSVSDGFRTLLHWPMSLNDFHNDGDPWVRRKAEQWGFTIEKVAGASYYYGWAERAGQDLAQRLNNVLADIRDQVKAMHVDKPAFDAWVEERGREGREFVDELRRRGILKTIPKRAPFKIDHRALTASGLSDDAASAILEYLTEDFSQDPYYCDTPPFNRMGGQAIYLLRKRH